MEMVTIVPICILLATHNDGKMNIFLNLSLKSGYIQFIFRILFQMYLNALIVFFTKFIRIEASHRFCACRALFTLESPIKKKVV